MIVPLVLALKCAVGADGIKRTPLSTANEFSGLPALICTGVADAVQPLPSVTVTPYVAVLRVVINEVCTPVDHVKEVAEVTAVSTALSPLQKDVLLPDEIETVGAVTIFTVTLLDEAEQPNASCISQE